LLKRGLHSIESDKEGEDMMGTNTKQNSLHRKSTLNIHLYDNLEGEGGEEGSVNSPPYKNNWMTEGDKRSSPSVVSKMNRKSLLISDIGDGNSD
jgi:hypothetical protein